MFDVILVFAFFFYSSESKNDKSYKYRYRFTVTVFQIFDQNVPDRIQTGCRRKKTEKGCYKYVDKGREVNKSPVQYWEWSSNGTGSSRQGMKTREKREDE